MSDFHPRAQLSTHEVFNQSEPFGDLNLFTADNLLSRLVRQAGGEAQLDHLASFGREVGTVEAMELGVLANRNPPQLKLFDRFGRRLDEVEFHPAYHELMAMGLKGGVSARAFTHSEGGHVAHAALLFLMSQAESGVTCPMSMTYAAVPALRQDASLAEAWIPRILAADYDGRSLPADRKTAVTIGMAMTEKQGGSDVRANTTRATLQADGTYELVGHKWFCSAPMSDAFLTLAYAGEALTCFLVPRWRANGERNAVELQRLKDKLGDRANASSEIEYRGAEAFRIGAEGRGVRTILEMVSHTRLDCTVGAASLMRQALSLAVRHVEGRSAFQRRLIDQPLMQAALADLAVEAEGCMALAFRLAQAFDNSSADPGEAALARLLTPVAKYWVTKRCPVAVAEAMEAHGGAGYIEEGLLPRLFRASPLNGIWEGSGNVMALDALRALAREPEAAEAALKRLAPMKALSPHAAEGIDELSSLLKGPPEEASVRRLAERLALLFAAATLAEWGRDHVAAALLEARLGGGSTYGAGRPLLDPRAVLEEARLQV